MVKPIAKGFSLIETLISSVLLAALSLTLIQTVIALNLFIVKGDDAINQNWQRQNLTAHRDLALIAQNKTPISIESTRFIFTDTNNDGIDDTWVEAPPNTSSLIVKTITQITYSNGAVDKIVSGVNTP